MPAEYGDGDTPLLQGAPWGEVLRDSLVVVQNGEAVLVHGFTLPDGFPERPQGSGPAGLAGAAGAARAGAVPAGAAEERRAVAVQKECTSLSAILNDPDDAAVRSPHVNPAGGDSSLAVDFHLVTGGERGPVGYGFRGQSSCGGAGIGVQAVMGGPFQRADGADGGPESRRVRDPRSATFWIGA